MQIDVKFPAKFSEWDKPARYKIARGGRGSGKTYTVFTKAIIKSLEFEADSAVIFTRNIDKSLDVSSLVLIKKLIKDLGISDLFDVTERTVKVKGGCHYVFSGLQNVEDNLKSIENVKLCVIEEARTVKQNALVELFPSIRGENSEIWIIYNPKKPDDAIHEMVEGGYFDGNSVVVDINYWQNPFFTDVLEKERKANKRYYSKEMYEHIWHGKVLEHSEDAIIKSEYFGRFEKINSLKQSIIIVDTANKAKERSDYTVALFAGVGIDNKVYLIDQIRGKWEAVERESNITAFYNKHVWRTGYGIGCKSIHVEDIGTGTELVQRLKRKGLPVKGIQRKRSASGFDGKYGRLMDVLPVIADFKNGEIVQNVLIPDGRLDYNGTLITDGAWVSDAISEYEEFREDDSHAHDDQVDVMIDAVKMLSVQNSSSLARAVAKRMVKT